MPAVVDTEKCNGCKSCESECPSNAVKVVDDKAVVTPDDCIDCNVEALPPDDRTVPPSMKPVHASITVRRNGTVSKVSVDYSPSRLTDEISGQLSQWLFEPAHKGSDTVESKKDVSLLLLCSGFPGRTETNRCTLHRSDEFSRSRTPTKIATPR